LKSKLQNIIVFQSPGLIGSFFQNLAIQINTYCRCYDEWMSIPGEDYYQIPPKCGEKLIEKLIHYILELTYLILLFQKLTVEAIRLQYIANAIRNRIFCSPTPYKKEPPIGGVKVGGEQHHNHRHVARTLYPRQSLAAMT
jgi:hypothetical protein